MEDLTNVTTTEETEVTTPDVSDNVERNYDDFDNNSSGGNISKMLIVGGAIAGLTTLGIAVYDKHKKKKEAEDKKKWNRDVNDIPKKEEEKEEVSEPDEVVDKKDVPDVKKKK